MLSMLFGCNLWRMPYSGGKQTFLIMFILFFCVLCILAAGDWAWMFALSNSSFHETLQLPLFSQRPAEHFFLFSLDPNSNNRTNCTLQLYSSALYCLWLWLPTQEVQQSSRRSHLHIMISTHEIWCNFVQLYFQVKLCKFWWWASCHVLTLIQAKNLVK